MMTSPSRRPPPRPIDEAERDAIVAQLRAHEARIAALERPRLRADEHLYGALHERIGSGVAFSTAEIIRFVATDPPLARVLECCGLTTPLRLGRRLGRLHRSGYVRLVGRNHEGAIWMVAV
jgi:hypothetical protein